MWDTYYSMIKILFNDQWNTNQLSKKDILMPFIATWMKPERIMLTEISHESKGKYWV